MVEGAKQFAGNIVDGLKQQPLLLAMVLLQIVLLGATVHAANANRAAERERFAAVMQLCGPRAAP